MQLRAPFPASLPFFSALNAVKSSLNSETKRFSSSVKNSFLPLPSYDIVVYPGDVPHKNNEQALKEKDLKKHLESELKKVDDNKTDTKETKTKAKTKETTKSDKEIVSQENLFKDLQLKSAVDAIKVLAIKK